MITTQPLRDFSCERRDDEFRGKNRTVRTRAPRKRFTSAVTTVSSPDRPLVKGLIDYWAKV